MTEGTTKFRVILIALLLFGIVVTGGISVIYINEISTDSQTQDSISAAEHEDLQAFATQLGISLQDAIDQYAWRNEFSAQVSRIRKIAPDSFTGAEIVDSENAWVAFAASAPQEALNIINTFDDSHDDVSIEVRTNKGFTEVELKKSIEAAHFAVLGRTEVSDANTGFDFATGEIRTLVVLKSSATDTTVNALQSVAQEGITDATRDDMLNSISAAVVQSEHPVISEKAHDAKHLGGEDIGCTTGFGTIKSDGERGISTAGHCPNNPEDDDTLLVFEADYEDILGDFQWNRGSDPHSNQFYSGSETETEVNVREVRSVGDPAVGDTLCRNGKVTHRTCQQVRKINFCAGDHCNLVQMGASYGKDGDSGGPVYWGNEAHGIHYGRVTDPIPPFWRDVFSRADLIDDALGVSIATE